MAVVRSTGFASGPTACRNPPASDLARGHGADVAAETVARTSAETDVRVAGGST